MDSKATPATPGDSIPLVRAWRLLKAQPLLLPLYLCSAALLWLAFSAHRLAFSGHELVVAAEHAQLADGSLKVSQFIGGGIDHGSDPPRQQKILRWEGAGVTERLKGLWMLESAEDRLAWRKGAGYDWGELLPGEPWGEGVDW